MAEASMEVKRVPEFNRKRAEGMREKTPKNLHLKARKLNPINTTSYVQILGTGMDTQDTSPCVLLFFDKQRFLFNVGEGLQRFCTEHKVKLSKIDHVFLTRVCSETAGGLPGLLLTLAGMGEEGMSVNIWGPSDLNYLVDAMRLFIPNAAMVHTHSFGTATNGSGSIHPDFEAARLSDKFVLIDDEVVKISAIPLTPNCDPLTPNCDRMPGDITINSFSNNLTSSGRVECETHFSKPLRTCSKTSHAVLSARKPGDISVIYVCELPEIKGKFNPEKAAALGLKPGPKYRELQLGNSVMSDERDIMVHPSDVLGPSSPGPVVLLVDCPTEYHLADMVSMHSLSCYYADSVGHLKGVAKSVNCIIHLGPSSVTKTADYQNWMGRFDTAQHIMAGHEIKNLAIPILKSSARTTSRLNYICPQLFPAPGSWSLQQTDNSVIPSSTSEGDSTISLCVSAENLLKFHLRPFSQLGLDRSVIPSTLDHLDIVHELLYEIPEVTNVSKEVSQLMQNLGEYKTVIPPKNEICNNVAEEQGLSESSCSPEMDWGEQGLDTSKEHDIVTTNGQIEEGRQHSNFPTCLENISREDMEFILLGTGSSHPSKYRNVSSIFVNLFSKGSVLLDCGEGTLAQLKRRFGVKGADEAVKNLRFIWVSHIHADHHTGLARVLALRCQLLRGIAHEPLLVIGPRQLKRFLDAYSRLEDLDMQFLDCRHTTADAMDSLACTDDGDISYYAESTNKDKQGENGECSKSEQVENSLLYQDTRIESFWKRPDSPVDTSLVLPVVMKLKEVLHQAGLEALYSVPVVHCPQAFGVVLKASDRLNLVGKVIPGWKFVYSGDTRPCQALVNASRNATVLIHEATFEDSMIDEAIARNHSTTREAINVGAEAGVYRVVLTHFSQRYPKVPVFDESHMHNTCIAFDLMSINMADLPLLPHLLPFLKLLFRNEMVAEEADELLDSGFNQ